MALVTKSFSDIITFTRASGATWFNSAGVLQGVDFSVTSNTIGTGSKTFTLDATAGVNRYWATGDTVLISDQSNSSNNMTGTVTSYTASTQVLVVNVTSTGGSGTIASWRIGSTMPRFDYNPATLAAQGLLIEEQRTNSIRNNTMQGAVAGTPGTLPNNWAVLGFSGLTREIVGVGLFNGVTYVDIKYSGTSSGTYGDIYFEGANVIGAANGQSWAVSAWVQVVAGTQNGVFSINFVLPQYDSGGVALGSATLGAPSATINTTWQRINRIGTTNNASIAFVRPQIAIGIASGQAIDITLRIGLPQLENNNISTGVASATVASGGSGYAVGDVLQIVGGTASTAARLTVATLSGSAVATVTVSTAGLYSVFPSPQPVSVTAITGTGTSATFNIVPQTQTGFATSVIPTTTAAVTRNADQASVNTLSPWYNQSEGTLFAEAQSLRPVSDTTRIVAISDNTANNSIRLNAASTTNSVVTLGANEATFSLSYTVGAVNKWAIAYASNNANGAVNGVTGTTDTSVAIPVVNILELGRLANGTSGSSLVGYLRRITYYPRRLSNAELVSITS